ncbi:MAG TPA: glycosyltransferase [Candidatus Saccharimonadales bacterium]
MGTTSDKTPDIFALAAQLQATMEDAAEKAAAQAHEVAAAAPAPVKTPQQELAAAFAIAKRRFRSSLAQLKRSADEPPFVSAVIPVFNKVEYTMRCLESLSRQVTHHTFEVVIVDNASSDLTPQLVPAVPGVRYIRNKKNEGFVDGCNGGVKQARGKVIILLNNDTEVLGGWMDSLVDRLVSNPAIGLVGSKLIYPDGRLQEAGGIIFNDATGHNFGKYEKADDFEYNYFREVDYCSGASVAFWRKDFNKLGGFDRRYAPAYYEDTDLAMGMRHKLGKKAVYEPHSVLVHIEGGTAGTNTGSGFKRYQAINHEKFLKKWKKELAREHYAPGTNPMIAARHGKRPRVLVVDSIVPEYSRDSGSLRMAQILKSLIKLGNDVTFFADNRVATQPFTSALQALGIEVVYGSGLTSQDFYKRRAGMYQTVILSRPTTAIWHLEYCKAYQPKARILYDTVDLHYLRTERRAETENKPALKKEAAQWRQLEHYLMDHTDATLVVSYEEQKMLAREKPKTKVHVLSNINEPVPQHAAPQTFNNRAGLLFIGSSHPPNEDAVTWFAKSILPLVRRELPDVELTLLGSNPSPKIAKLANAYVHVPGFIEDVSPYFTRARVFVCPMRYGAGVKGKVSQSLSYGLPVVSTAVGREGMHLVDGKSCLAAESAEDFARQVVRLYTDSALWQTISEGGQAVYEQHFSEAAGLKALQDALK